MRWGRRYTIRVPAIAGSHEPQALLRKGLERELRCEPEVSTGAAFGLLLPQLFQQYRLSSLAASCRRRFDYFR